MSRPPNGVPPTQPPDPAPIQVTVRELPAEGTWRIFLVAVPAARVLTQRDRRLAGLHLPELTDETGPEAARRRRLVAATLDDARDRVARDALETLLRGMGLRPEGQPRLDILTTPPEHDLVLRIAVPLAPAVEPPDPATIRLRRLVARPGPAEVAQELAALTEARADWAEQPPGTPAGPGDILLCDVTTTLAPQPNRIPRPGLDGAAPGRPGRLPDSWAFGDNGAGLAMEVLSVHPAPADPPHLRLRVSGTAPSDGQSFVMFHASRAIAAEPGSTWVGSLALRPIGPPVGLRGGKLRLHTKPTEGDRTLQRKDAALAGAFVAATAPGDFGRVYVSNTFAAPDTAHLIMVVLFDHAAGPVDFTVDLAAPRLVEGLDLGHEDIQPLPRFSGEARRFALGEAEEDALGLLPHLDGLRTGETREIVLRLPDRLGDRALTGRTAVVKVEVRAVLRRDRPALDDALAAALGFPGLAALRAEAAIRATRRFDALSEARLRADLEAALLAAAADVKLPEPAIWAELAVIQPALVAALGRPPEPDAARDAATRSLRLRLVTEALARRHGIPMDETPADSTELPARRRALADRVAAFLLSRISIEDREATPAELAPKAG